MINHSAIREFTAALFAGVVAAITWFSAVAFSALLTWGLWVLFHLHT